ncbi:MAG: 16S rRNA (adenine(1518)-N(6)/adenine(1519)-N(6))-dimethyltransferase RsmA [Syntrophobacteraceae bacterium]
MMPEFLTPSQYFHQKGVRPRKHFGQHFLAQPATAARIVSSAEPAGLGTAVEIGPGLGALTRFLAPSVRRLHLVELDRDMAGYLRDIFPGGEEEGVMIHERDALAFDFAGLARKEGSRLVVLGNLPYNISSPLLFHLLEAFPAIERAVFMVQKEVGDRFAAAPGGKDYGVLSVLLGIYSKVSKLFTVGPAQFYPQPKVESIVIRIDFHEKAPPGPPFSFMRRFVSITFQQRRKTLQNSLKGAFALPQAALVDAFAKAGVDPKRRPETLSPAEFVTLAEEVREAAGGGERL